MELPLIPDQDLEQRPANVVQDGKNHKAFYPGAAPVVAQGDAPGQHLVAEDPQHGIAGQVAAVVRYGLIHICNAILRRC
jgi:hypothetical protein